MHYGPDGQFGRFFFLFLLDFRLYEVFRKLVLILLSVRKKYVLCVLGSNSNHVNFAKFNRIFDFPAVLESKFNLILLKSKKKIKRGLV